MSAKNESDDQMEFSTLQNNFAKQQAQISALKELVRKTEITNERTTYTQEKVKNIAQRLTHIKSKARTRQNSDISLSDIPVAEVQISSECIDTSITDLKMSSEKPRNEKFLLLRQQMKQNKLKMAEREITKKEIEEKVFQLKAKIDSTQLSLEKSTELGRSMTELSSFPGTPVSRFRSSADLSFIPLNIDKERIKFLENRIKFLDKQQENEKELAKKCQCKNQIDTLEFKILDLQDSLKEKDCIIKALQSDDSSNSLQDSSDESKNNLIEIEFLKKEILKLCEKNNHLEQTYNNVSTKNSELKIELTNILELNKNLQNQFQDYVPLETESLHNDETESIHSDKTKSLENYLEIERKNYQNQFSKNQDYEEQLLEKDVEYNVLKANFLVLEEKFKSSPKTLFSQNTDKLSETETNKLKQQLDDSNKSMIKLKLKTKQLQKQIDDFGKISNINNDLIKQQKKINDLQDENRQLHLLNNSSKNNIINKDICEKIEILETTCNNQTSAIKILEEEKLLITDNLNQMQSIKKMLCTFTKKLFAINDEKMITIPDFESLTLDEIITNFNINIESIFCLYNKTKQENLALQNKLISDLSFEEIDVMEKQTQQLEFTASNASKDKKNLGCGIYSEIVDNDLIDSLVKLREESSELLQKIEIFTLERKEILDKMETLSNVNRENILRNNVLENERVCLLENIADLKCDKSNLENEIQVISGGNMKLKEEIDNLRNQTDISKISVASKANNLNISLAENFIENCENHFEKLCSEIENYRKISNKSNKLQASKKLANEAEITINEMRKLIAMNKHNMTGLETSDPNLEQTKIVCTQVLETGIRNQTEILEQNCLQSILESKINMLEKENYSLKSLTEEFKEQLIESLHEKQVMESHGDNLKSEINNKQETINTLNSQIMDLYESVENKTTELIEKEDALINYQEMLDANLLNIRKLEEENNESKAMFEKHLQNETGKLRGRIDELVKLNADLEAKTIKQLDKLKKFVANIKKKNLDYNNLENKVIFLEQNLLEEKNNVEEQIKILEQKHYIEQNLVKENNNLLEKIKFLEEQHFSGQINLQAKEKNDLQEKIKFLEAKHCSEQELLHENKDLLEKLKLIELKLSSEQNLLQKNNDLEEIIKTLEQKQCSEEKLLGENNDLHEKIKHFEQEIQKINFSKIQEIQNITNEYQLLESNFNFMQMELHSKIQEIDQCQINLERIINERDTLKNENFSQLQDIENKNDYIEKLLNEINGKNVTLNNFQDLIKVQINEIDVLKYENNLNLSNLETSEIRYNELEKNYTEILHKFGIEKQSFYDKIFKLDTLSNLVKEKLNEYISDEIQNKNSKTVNIELQDAGADNKSEFENLLWDQLQNNENFINVSKNERDDEALIENQSKRFLVNDEMIDLKEKYNILSKEIMDLKIVLSEKDDYINNLIKLNKTPINNEILSYEENKSSYRQTQSDDETISSYVFCPPYLEEEGFEQQKEHVTNMSAQQTVKDKCKIENLQQNITDLEIVVDDLKNKLRNLTKINEEVTLQMDQNTMYYNQSISDYEVQVKFLENKLETNEIKCIENFTCKVDSDVNNLNEPEDDWGWEGNKLFEDKNETNPLTNETIINLTSLFENEKIKVESLSTRIEELELAQKRLYEEKQALQIKSGKLMKKLKEYKVKVEQQNKFKCSVDSDLNQNLLPENKTTDILKKVEEDKIEKEIVLDQSKMINFDENVSSNIMSDIINNKNEDKQSNTVVSKKDNFNEHVLLCSREIEEKYNLKISDFIELWNTNILENSEISQEILNILQVTQQKPALINPNNIEVKEVKNSDIINNMSKAIENQKLEIVTLQDQLALKSSRDPYAQISYSLVSSALGETNNTNKSELDFTLYVLHQRDMRCEELELELVNLLKERDMLQLKLSNTIRQNEDFREKFETLKDQDDFQFPYEHSSSISLQNRLSQLDTLDSRTVIENRERDLERMQQDVANIPTEAVTELVGEEMANSMESASTLLLNWFWGKSRPS